MREAMLLARLSALEGEVPVGAVVTRAGGIVGRGRNRRETGKNALAHAELEAIAEACQTLGGWRLWECTLYVTLEPCPMCTGALINARMRRVVFGAYDAKAGSCGSVVDLFALPYNHKPILEGGYMEQECASLLTDFSAGCGKAVKVKDKLGDVETMSEATKPADCGGNCESCGADCSSRQQDMHIPLNQYSTVRKVIGIVSGKGGVGKSLVTSLTACAMQSRGYATAVFDADVTGPSIPKAFGITEKAKGNELGLLPENPRWALK